MTRDGRPPAKISVVLLVYNALRYTRLCVSSLQATTGVDHELVVVDNASRLPTRLFLVESLLRKKIHRLCLLDRNTYFAEGNNVGAALGSRDTTHILFINSDVQVRDPLWLQKLLTVHRPGATAYGYLPGEPWPRADGYCLLIDRPVFERYRLDEGFQWWWSITKLQAQLLRDGLSVQAIRSHDDTVHHSGAGSGPPPHRAGGMDLRPEVVREWFEGRNVRVIETL